MAIARPPAWYDIENDERFGALTPDEKLKTFNQWATDTKDYGVSSGMFLESQSRADYLGLVDEKTKEFAPPAPKEKSFIGIGDTVSALGEAAVDVYKGFPASYYSLTEGLKRPDQYSPEAKAAFASSRERNAQLDAERVQREQAGTETSVGSTIREAGKSLNFSLANMAAAIPAGLAAGAVAGAVFPPSEAVTVPVGAVAAMGAAALASAPVAYRMAGQQFLDDAFYEKEQRKGRPLSEKEKDDAYKILLPIAQNTGLWEAGPEAVGNAVSFGVGGLVLGFGKDTAVKLASKALTQSGLKATEATATDAAIATLTKLSRPITQESVGAVRNALLADAATSTLRKVGEKAAAVAGAGLIEVGGEALTQTRQGFNQAQARQYAQTGSVEGAIDQYQGLAGFGKAVKEVGPVTLATMGIMGSLAGGVKVGSIAATSSKNKQIVSDISETLRTVQTLQENSSPLTASAVANSAASNVENAAEAARMRELTMQGEQAPVKGATTAPAAAPTVTTPTAAVAPVEPTEIVEREEPPAPIPTPTEVVPTERPTVAGFTTAKGSTYEVTPEGKTIRTKRSEGRGQGETYEPHSVLFVPEQTKLDIQSDMASGMGENSLRIGYTQDNRFVQVTDTAQIPADITPQIAIVNRKSGQIITNGVYDAQRNPEVGLGPIEKLYSPDGTSSTHIGNQITEIRPVTEVAPAVPPAAVAPTAVAPTVTIPDRYKPEALANLDDSRLLANGETLAKTVAELQRQNHPNLPVAQAALENARNEWRKRQQQRTAAAAAQIPGDTGPSKLLVRTPEEIAQAREASFGLDKTDPFRKYVQSLVGENSSAAGLIKVLADSGVVPQGTQSLAEIQNPDQVTGWLKENKFDEMKGKSLPLFLQEKSQRGETLTPFTENANMPLFQAAAAAAPTVTAPTVTAPTETVAPTVTAPTVTAPTETAATAPVAPTEAPAALAPADEAFNKAQARLAQIRADRGDIQAQMRSKLGQASMGADPELAFLAVKLAINYAQEGIVRFSDWSARVKQDFPDIWDGIKDYLQEAWNTARAQTPELEPLEGAPATPTVPAVTPTPTMGALPLAPAAAGERAPYTFVPPQRTEGVVMGGIVSYRQNLVKEAQDAGVRTVRRTFGEIEADMKGKGWNGRKSLKRFISEVINQANAELQQGVATIPQAIPESKEEQTIYSETRKNKAVPTMATVVSKMSAKGIRPGLRKLKEARLKVNPTQETLGYLTTLRVIQKNAETQLASDLGITNPSTIRFTYDVDGELRIPNRISTTVTSPGSLTNAADLVVKSPDPNTTQEEIEGTISSNRIKVRAYLATLPNGSYEIKDDIGNVVGTLVIERPEIVAPAATSKKVAGSLPKIQRLIEKKDEINAKIRETRQRLLSLSERETSPTALGELELRWAGSKVITSKGESGVVIAKPFLLPSRSLVVGEKNLNVPVQFSKKDTRIIPVSELTVTEYGDKPMQGAPGEGKPGVVVNTKEIQKLLGSLQKESVNLESQLNTLINKARQQVMEFALTTSSTDPNPELLVTLPSTEGELSDYARFIEADGAEGILFDAVEYLSGNTEDAFEDVFVNDPEITARQLDQGKTLVVPEDMRGRIVPGIKFDENTGNVTGAISSVNGGTVVTQAGQLTAAAKEAQTVLDTDYSPVPEELANIEDVIAGIVRDPDTGEVISQDNPLTTEQITQLETADTAFGKFTTKISVDEGRAVAIARVIFARALSKGVTISPLKAFEQAVAKLGGYQKYRPQALSIDVPISGNENVQLEENTADEVSVDDGYADEPSIGRVEAAAETDIESLVRRRTTLSNAKLIVADPEAKGSVDAYVLQHAKDMLALRRKLSKAGKLKGFTQKEISQFTMPVLEDIDRRPLAMRGPDMGRKFFSASPDDTTTPEVPIQTPQIARALRILKEVVGKYYPGIREVLTTDGKARMHVDAILDRSLFTNPERLARVIESMDDNDAAAFIRASALHEYYHLGLLRKVGLDGLEKIGGSLTGVQLEEAADMYHSRAKFGSKEERDAAYAELKADKVRVAMEFITMLAERMKNGQSIQEMPELVGMKKNILQRILAAVKTIWRRLETHARVYANPALREKLQNLHDGVRELDQLAYGESVYPERDVQLREAPPQYANQVGRIFESYKGGDGLRQFIVTLPGRGGIKTGTRAADEADAVRKVIGRLVRDNGFVIINDKRFTNSGYAITEALPKRDANAAKRIAKVEVPKAERTLAKVNTQPAPDGKPQQGSFEFYSYSPDTRVREGAVGREKGGFWDNLKSIFTGRFSETQARVGGLGSSGKWTPQQRDIRLKQNAKIKADLAKAEFLVAKYKRELGKAFKDPKDIPTDTLNMALGSTANKYSDAQYAQLQAAPDEQQRAILVQQFMEENIAASEARIQEAQNALPENVRAVLQDMRETMKGLSKKLIEGGYISEELKLVVEANKEVYLHRSYHIFDNPEWKKLMEKPAPGSEHERIVNAADRLFRMKAQADIARDLRNEYAQRGISMDVDKSLELAAGYGDDIALAAHNMMIDYLSVADDQSFNYMMTGVLPGQRKMDILKERGQIPKEIRELWGEIQNNETNFVKTVGKMSAFMASTDTARQLLDVGIKDGSIWKKGLSAEPVPPAGYRPIYEPGTISDHNALKDAYAPQDVREAFRSLRDVDTMNGWAKWFSGMTAWAMAAKTVGNFPQGYVRNFLGNPLLVINGGFVTAGDIVNPINMMRNAKLGVRTALANTGLRFDEAIQEKRNEYIRNGVVGDGAEAGLFREMVESSMNMNKPGIDSLWESTSAQDKLKKAANLSTGKAKAAFDFMAGIYQGVDDFWKVFAYEQEKKFQKAAHPDWTDTQIQDESANRVRNKLPTYSMSPEITKSIRRTPFIAPFITWTSEVLRTGANTVAIAAEDIRVGRETGNKKMVNNGVRALLGTLISASMIPMAVAASKAIAGYDDDDDEAIRTFVPDYEKNDQLLYIGQRADGKASYINLSYLDPQQMRAETMIAFYRALRGDKGAGEAFLEAGAQMLSPIMSEQLFASAVMDLARNRTAQGAPIWNEQDSPTNKTLTKFKYIANALLPGTVSGAGRRIYSAATGTVQPNARSYKLSDELAGVFLGQRVAEVDAQTSLVNKVSSFLSKRSDATQLLTRVLNSRGTVDVAEIPAAYDNASVAMQEIYTEMSKAYNMAIKLGVPRAKAIKILDEGRGRGMSDSDKAAVVRGIVPVFTVSQASLDNTLTSAPTRQEGIERRRAYRQHLQAMKKVNQANKNK